MFPELFSQFIIDSDDSDSSSDANNIRCNNVHNIDHNHYFPINRSPRWFLHENLNINDNDDNDNDNDNDDDDKTREIVRNRAAFAYLHGDYITAMDIYLYMLHNEASRNDSNSNSQFPLIDSVIRCGLKFAPVNGPQLLLLLQKMHSLVSTYDEQLQYWSLSLEVYLIVGTNSIDYLRNAILLCASVDLPEFWILLSKYATGSCASLRIGSLCRALCILENSRPNKAGWLGIYDPELIKAELRSICSEEKLREAKAAVCSDLAKTREDARRTVSSHLEFGKGILKSENAQTVMISEFIRYFKWLFTNINDRTINTLLHSF